MKKLISIFFFLCFFSCSKDDERIQLTVQNESLHLETYRGTFDFEGYFEEDTLKCIVYSIIPLKDSSSLYIKEIYGYYEKNKIDLYIETPSYFPSGDTLEAGVKFVPNKVKFDLYPLRQKKYNVEISINGISRIVCI